VATKRHEQVGEEPRRQVTPEQPTALELPQDELSPEMEAYFALCLEKLGFVPNVLRAYALDNAKLPLELMGLSDEDQRKRALAWLNRLGLANFTNAYPHELSGGMRQRVAIARAFSVQPQILLADEAFGHLDEVTAAELRETFLSLARETGATAILITHQLEEAIAVGDRIVVFGQSAKLLADIRVAQWPAGRYGALREAIQATLQNQRPDPRLLA